MEVGQIWKDPVLRFVDPVSGRTITRLTGYKGHSNNLYFTDDFWVTDSSFVFVSDRENASNLFLCDLEREAITQLTAFRGPHRPDGLMSKATGRLLFFYGPVLHELDPRSMRLRVVAEIEPGLQHTGMHAVTCDGRWACTCLRTALDARERSVYNKSPDYLEKFREQPLSRIVRIEIATGKIEAVHEERCFVEHVNASPTDADVLTFCHEGPWARVDQRIWGLNTASGRIWKIRPQDGRDAAIGHEYFLPGGQWIGYHGRRLPEERLHFFGATRLDNSERFEHDFGYHCTHVVSRDLDVFLGDGTPANVQPWFPSRQKPFLMLFRRTPEGFDGPRVLAFHRATFNEQCQHPHASFTPDGRRVLYTSDMGGYSNVHLVELGAIEDLPRVEDVDIEWGKPGGS